MPLAICHQLIAKCKCFGATQTLCTTNWSYTFMCTCQAGVGELCRGTMGGFLETDVEGWSGEGMVREERHVMQQGGNDCKCNE